MKEATLDELEKEANEVKREIRYLIFSVLAVALFMLTVTLVYSLFR